MRIFMLSLCSLGLLITAPTIFANPSIFDASNASPAAQNANQQYQLRYNFTYPQSYQYPHSRYRQYQPYHPRYRYYKNYGHFVCLKRYRYYSRTHSRYFYVNKCVISTRPCSYIGAYRYAWSQSYGGAAQSYNRCLQGF